MKVDSVWCPVCLMRFTSKTGVVQHIAGSKLCGLNLLRYDDIPAEQIKENLAANAVFKKSNKDS